MLHLKVNFKFDLKISGKMLRNLFLAVWALIA